MNELCLVEIKEFKKVRDSEQTQRLINGFQWQKTETFVDILNTLQLSYNLTALLITKCDPSSVWIIIFRGFLFPRIFPAIFPRSNLLVFQSRGRDPFTFLMNRRSLNIQQCNIILILILFLYMIQLDNDGFCPNLPKIRLQQGLFSNGHFYARFYM